MTTARGLGWRLRIGSFHGLRALARGSADGAAIHLRHHSGTHNAPFPRALLRHRRPLPVAPVAA